MDGKRSSDVLVGRDAELDELRGALALKDAPVLLLVTGEAGVGKSRLVRQFAQQAGAPELPLLVGECLDVGWATIPYAPFLPVLRQLATWPAGGNSARRAREVLHSIAPGPGPAPGSSAAGRPVAASLEPVYRMAFFSGLLDTLEQAGRSKRVLIVLEDLHWADSSTLGLLEYLVRNGASERLVLIGTQRTGYAGRDGQLRRLTTQLLRHGRLKRLDLQPLDWAASRTLVERILGAPSDDHFVNRIYDRSGGNAFFIEALLAQSNPSSGNLSRDLREILTAQLEGMPEGVSEVARVLAVTDERLPVPVIAASLGTGIADVRHSLRAEQAGAVLIEDESGSFAFRHALLREAMAGEMSEQDQRETHRKLARALESAADGARWAAARAAHWQLAGDDVRALVAHVEAAEQAAVALAPEQAGVHYELAARLHPRVAQVELPTKLQSVSEAHLLAAASVHHAAAGAMRRSLTLAGEGEAAARAAGDAQLVAELALRRVWALYRMRDGTSAAEVIEALEAEIRNDPDKRSLRGFLLSELAMTRFITGHSEAALEPAETALEIALADKNEALEAEARVSISSVALDLQQVSDARRHIERAWQLMRSRGSLSEQIKSSPLPTVRIAAGNVGYNFAELGAYEQALAVAEWALSNGDAQQPGWWLTDVPAEEVTAGGDFQVLAALALQRLGRWPEAVRRLRAALRLHDAGLTFWLHAGHAHVQLASGRFAAAARSIGAAWRAAPHPLEPRGHVYIDEAAAELALWEGRTDVLRATVAAGLHAVEHMPNRDALALPLHVLRLRGEASAPPPGRRQSRAPARDHSLRLRELAIEEAAEALAGLRERETTQPTAALMLQCEAEQERVTGASTAQLWHRAADAWRQLKRPYDEAYCLWQEAEALLGSAERPEAAFEALLCAHEICRHLGARPLRHAVERSAARAGLALARHTHGAQRSQPAVERLGGLSPREMDVLVLIADGATNRQIASQLLISERTAGIHVSSILRKLDVETRGQAAALAHRGGISGAERIAR